MNKQIFDDTMDAMERVTAMLGTMLDELECGGKVPTQNEINEIYNDVVTANEGLCYLYYSLKID